MRDIDIITRVKIFGILEVFSCNTQIRNVDISNVLMTTDSTTTLKSLIDSENGVLLIHNMWLNNSGTSLGLLYLTNTYTSVNNLVSNFTYALGNIVILSIFGQLHLSNTTFTGIAKIQNYWGRRAVDSAVGVPVFLMCLGAQVDIRDILIFEHISRIGSFLATAQSSFSISSGEFDLAEIDMMLTVTGSTGSLSHFRITEGYLRIPIIGLFGASTLLLDDCAITVHSHYSIIRRASYGIFTIASNSLLSSTGFVLANSDIDMFLVRNEAHWTCGTQQS